MTPLYRSGHRRILAYVLPWAAGCAYFPALANPMAAFHDTGAIDRQVEQFTGQSVGATGGARSPVDPRLKLHACNVPLELDWHGQPGRSVAVRCPQPQGWRIFVNLVAGPATAAHKPVVQRGETVSIAIRGRGFTIQRQGEALASGAQGDWIAVRTEQRGEPVRARIERPGLVVIPLG